MNTNQSTSLHFKDINKLALPAILSGIIEPILSMTDLWVAGKLDFHPDISMGAVALVGSLFSTMVWVLAQSRNSISSYLSQYLGRGQIKRMTTLINNVFYFNLILTLILVGLGVLFSKALLQVYGADETLLEEGAQYFSIRVLGLPCIVLTYILFGVFRGLQNTSYAFYISFTGAFLNIILSVWMGLYLDWGIAGIAWGSVLAYSVMFGMALIFLYIKTQFTLQPIFKFHFLLGDAMLMNFNLVIRALFLNLALFLANRQATLQGVVVLDTHSIMMQLWLFSAFFIDGYAQAGNAMAGKLWGQKDYIGLFRLTKKLMLYTLAICGFLMLLYASLYTVLPQWFTQNKEIHELFYQFFWCVIAMQPINGIAFLMDGIYKGLGRARFLRDMQLGATVLGFIPTLYLVSIGYPGLIAIWSAFFVWILIRSIAPLWDFNEKYYSRS